MNQEKQIYQVSKILAGAARRTCEELPFEPADGDDDCNRPVQNCRVCKEARALIDEGYAKKSEIATSVINDLLDLLYSNLGDIKMSPDTTYQIVYLYAKEVEKKYTEGKK